MSVKLILLFFSNITKVLKINTNFRDREFSILKAVYTLLVVLSFYFMGFLIHRVIDLSSELNESNIKLHELTKECASNPKKK